MVKITFLGAAKTVTGSKYLLEFDNKKILVDCGLFQGFKELRVLNWAPPYVDPASLDAVILTHAHLDHSGYIPILVKQGFKGRIYSSKSTKELSSILLADSGHLQEEDAKYANSSGFTRHAPALPLYTVADALHAMNYFYPIECNQEIQLPEGISLKLHPSGHILGATSAILKIEGKTIVFTGDIGRLNDPILYPPEPINEADYLIVESTYGNRLHESIDPKDEIAEIVNDTIKKGGSLIIPAFAVGRSQVILYFLYQLKKEKRIPNVQIYLDSPMAINMTNLFCQAVGQHKLNTELAIRVYASAKYLLTPHQSMEIDRDTTPKIIISASGMATGGRILHHLKTYAPDSKNTILFVGYQSEGTRGDRMIRGEKTIKIHGDMVPVAAKIAFLQGASAHADYLEMLEWLESIKKAPKKVFVTHGSPPAGESFKAKLEEKFGWDCVVPNYLQSFEI